MDVEPRFKGTDGAPGVRPWVCPDGDVSCARRAPCRACRGRRNRRKGQVKQRAAVKGLGIPPPRFASQQGHEENLRGPVRIEVKSGAQVGPIDTRFLAAEAQSEASRPIGDGRPFVMVAAPDGMSDQIVLLRISKLGAVLAAYDTADTKGL